MRDIRANGAGRFPTQIPEIAVVCSVVMKIIAKYVTFYVWSSRIRLLMPPHIDIYARKIISLLCHVSWLIVLVMLCIMMTSWHGNIIRITPHYSASLLSQMPVLGCFVMLFYRKAVQQMVELPTISDPMALIWRHYNMWWLQSDAKTCTAKVYAEVSQLCFSEQHYIARVAACCNYWWHRKSVSKYYIPLLYFHTKRYIVVCLNNDGKHNASCLVVKTYIRGNRQSPWIDTIHATLDCSNLVINVRQVIGWL